MRRIILAASAAVLALLAAACGASGNSAAHSAPPTTAAEHAAIQKGLGFLEGCTPNGQAMIGGVVDGTASGLTYLQDAQFLLHGGIHKVFSCLAVRHHLTPAQKKALEDCGADKVTAVIKADRHIIHDRRTVLPAVFNAAALCAGKYVS